MYQRVLFPTDGSPGANHAAAHAFELADRYGAAIHALSVVNSASLGPDVRTMEVTGRLEANAQAAVDDITAQASKHGITDVAGEVVTGTPHQAILEYAGEHDIDIIVMSTHGRSGIDRYLLGSVTEKVVRAADVPVLTVQVPEEVDE